MSVPVRVVVPVLMVVLLPVAARPARADQVSSLSDLESLLGDAFELEDFEGVSVAGGTVYPVPNPLSSQTAPNFGLLSGVACFAPQWSLVYYGGYMNGDDTVLVQTHHVLDVTFDLPQRAVGLDVLNTVGNVVLGEIVRFRRGDAVLGELVFSVGSGQSTFAGWTDDYGITSIELVGTTQSPGIDHVVMIDNVGFGASIGDLDHDGAIGFGDLLALLSAWGPCNDPADCPADLDHDGAVGFSDLLALLSIW